MASSSAIMLLNLSDGSTLQCGARFAVSDSTCFGLYLCIPESCIKVVVMSHLRWFC